MNELGWTPITVFIDGIVFTIDWYLSDSEKKWTNECASGEYLKWINKKYKERV